MDARGHNKKAWDAAVDQGVEWVVPWSTPVNSMQIADARAGRWDIILTPCKPVPPSWLPKKLTGKRVLCLASGGGQQGPLIAAAGADVTVLDNSPQQLARDRLVSERENLQIKTIEGDMNDLSMLGPDSFDYIVHPASNCYAEEVRPMWTHCHRVLVRGGALLSGFTNPVAYAFDPDLEQHDILQLKYALPYSDVKSLEPDRLAARLEANDTLQFSHSLEDQIGGQIDAGFLIAGFYEDYWRAEGPRTGLDKFMPQFIGMRALKP